VGEERRVGPLAVTVLQTSARGLPTRVRFRFDEPLEAERYEWLTWQGRRPVPLQLPAVGAQVELPGLDLARSL
jgi:hypothetical protein